MSHYTPSGCWVISTQASAGYTTVHRQCRISGLFLLVCLCPNTGCLEKGLPNTLYSVLGLSNGSLDVYIKDKYFVYGLTGEAIDRGIDRGGV